MHNIYSHHKHVPLSSSTTLNGGLIVSLFLSILPLQQSSKVYKRHSSIIPSSHLLAEVQETMPSLDGNDFEPGQYHYKAN